MNRNSLTIIRLFFFIVLLIVSGFVFVGNVSIYYKSNIPKQNLSPIQELGKHIFFDESLSNPSGTSCASCHHPQQAFSDLTHASFSIGATGNAGKRNSPSLSYIAYSPHLNYNQSDDEYTGGYFWDGRASSIEAQIEGPLFNPIEMNIGSKTELIHKIRNASYVYLFKHVFGSDILADTNKAYECITKAIARYEESFELNLFNSKFDWYLEGKTKLTLEEKRGLELFNDPKKGNCAACHPSTPDSLTSKVLFTDYTYDNIGIPLNERQPNLNDIGLGDVVNKKKHAGKFKVPTLRNIASTAPYFHNGKYHTLKEVVDFYNLRDTGKFGKPEIADNINMDELGNLNLTEDEVNAIVAFLNTLTDNYHPKE